MSSSFPVDPSFAAKAAQDQDMVRRKMEIDAMRQHLTPGKDQQGKLREACQGFETIFIQKLWEQMRNNVPKEGYLHSKQEAMYQSMYDNEFSKKMAESGGIGLGDMLYEQLSRSLGESSRSASPGVNPRLPIVPATSSPANLKYSQEGAKTLPAGFNNSHIKPLYEDFDENSNLEQFTLPGRGAAPGPNTAVDLERYNRFAPQSVPAVEAQAAIAAQGQAVASAAGVDGLDFESLSRELLQTEMSQTQAVSAAEPGNQTPARPVSSYAQAFNRRQAAALSPEDMLVLQEALRASSNPAGPASPADQEGRAAELSAGRSEAGGAQS